MKRLTVIFVLLTAFVVLAVTAQNTADYDKNWPEWRGPLVIGVTSLDSRLGLNQGFDYYEDDLKTRGKPKNTSAERRGDMDAKLKVRSKTQARSCGPFQGG